MIKKITLNEVKSLIKKIINENTVNKKLSIINEDNLNEIDWDNDFEDVKKTCIEPNSLVEYLNQVIDNRDKSTKNRTKFDKDKPFVHSKSTFFDKDKNTVDVEEFKKRITQTPEKIIGTNDKMDKTGDLDTFVYKTGVPAFRGIVFDKENNKFFIINTCPGAGSCVFICYALKGFFIRYAESYDKMTRVLNYLMNEPEGFKQQLKKEIKDLAIEHEALKGNYFNILIRCNDSGDFFSKKYYNISKEIVDELQKEGYNVSAYGHTKIADIANDTDEKIITSFSTDANKKEISKVDFTDKRTSTTIPKELFKGLNLNSFADNERLRKIVADNYKLDLNTVITYRELMRKSVGDKKVWNVIVVPGNGDDMTFRKDVLRIYHTLH